MPIRCYFNLNCCDLITSSLITPPYSATNLWQYIQPHSVLLHLCFIEWWRLQMETIFRVTCPLWGEFTGHRWIPLTKASEAELTNVWANNRDAVFFQTPSRSLWRQCNGALCYISPGTYDPILCRCPMSYSRCPPPLYHYISVPCEPVSSSVGAVTGRSELIFLGNKMAVKQSVQMNSRSCKLLISRRYFVRDFICIRNAFIHVYFHQ